MPANILNLPDYKVVRVEETDQDYNRRWRCQDCGKTAMKIPPAVNSKREMTERLVQWTGKCNLKRTFASLAVEAGLDENTIRNIFRD